MQTSSSCPTKAQRLYNWLCVHSRQFNSEKKMKPPKSSQTFEVNKNQLYLRTAEFPPDKAYKGKERYCGNSIWNSDSVTRNKLWNQISAELSIATTWKGHVDKVLEKKKIFGENNATVHHIFWLRLNEHNKGSHQLLKEIQLMKSFKMFWKLLVLIRLCLSFCIMVRKSPAKTFNVLFKSQSIIPSSFSVQKNKLYKLNKVSSRH